MKILIICNNFDSSRDGIGKYGKITYDKFKKVKEVDNVYYLTAYTNDSSRIQKLLSFKMMKALLKASHELKKKEITHLIIEYPFQEYNPCILPAFVILCHEAKMNEIKIVVSLHEYIRANHLRKNVINFMVKRADVTLVSDEETKMALKDKSNNIHIRNMFGNIYTEEKVVYEKKKEQFVYFGLVNKSKAFAQMLDAWKEFNRDNKFELIIISSSDLSNFSINKEQIKVYHDLTDQEVAKLMLESRYCILPIFPDISSINGTFKTASLFGCICIGRFCKEYSSLKHIINIDSYDIDMFIQGLTEAANLSNPHKEKMFVEAVTFGEKYGPEGTVSEIIKAIR